MGLPAAKTKYSLDEYFKLTEKEGDVRYEYHFGEIVAMAGALLRHNRIVGNFYATFHAKLRGRRCVPFNSDTRLRVEDGLWVYPDVMISCHEADIKARLYIEHPSLIVEVLSGSTRKTDYSVKKANYFKMVGLQYVILVDTERIFIDVYEKQGDFWVNKIYTAGDTHVPLPLLDLELLISDLYEWVTFDDDEVNED